MKKIFIINGGQEFHGGGGTPQRQHNRMDTPNA